MKVACYIFVSVLTLTLTNCATTRAYEESLRSWEGKTRTQLVQRWGNPSQVTPLADGGSLLTYNKGNVPQYTPRTPANEDVVVGCRTQFLLNPSRQVVGWKYNGPDCRGG